MAKIASIKAKYHIVTPMFLGDAEQEAGRVRESSFKGALCFWWRALNLSRMVAQAGGDVRKGLAALRKREIELFGGPQGQGRFSLLVTPSSLSALRKREGLRYGVRNGAKVGGVGGGARYLGYGLMEAFGAQAGCLTRSCIKSGQAFTVRILFRPVARAEDHSDILQALKLLGLVGGLGSRVRRGWGSLALVSMTGDGVEGAEWAQPEWWSEYSGSLEELLKDSLQNPGSAYDITAFAAESRIDMVTTDEDWESSDPLVVLNRLGEGLQRYRAWGHKGKVNDRDSEQNFKADHDWCKDHGKGTYVPRRAAFGLPHNYSKELGVSATGNFDRRASPLFFHIHRYADGVCTPVILFLPTRFLPEEAISINDQRRSYKNDQRRSYKFDASVITDFLDGVRPGKGLARPAYIPGDTIIGERKQ